MEHSRINVKYVSKKISKIRWRPRSRGSLQQSDVFSTGSWDDEENKVCLWRHISPFVGTHILDEEFILSEPQQLCEVNHPGDVCDLCFMSMDLIATASSTGSVLLFQYHPLSQDVAFLPSPAILSTTFLNNCGRGEGLGTTTCLKTVVGQIKLAHNWSEVHRSAGHPCPSTCLATYADDTILSGGEDGRLVLLTPGRAEPTQVLEKADSCTINALTFLKQSEVLSLNSFGQLKLFDLRSNDDSAAQIFSATDEHIGLLCVDKHPGQLHVVATGSQDGLMTIWDLRQNRFPMTTLDAHQSSMWEVRFHPHHTKHLFSCSEDGSLWSWDASGNSSSTGTKMHNAETPNNQHADQSPWLGLGSIPKLEITSLICGKSLSVNSLDIEGSLLLCGTDNENIYTLTMPHLN